MIRADILHTAAASLALVGGLVASQAASAQSLGYDSVSGTGASGEDGGASGGPESGAVPSYLPRKGRQGEGNGAPAGKRIQIKPYIEIDQVVDADFTPRSDVLTYSQVAVGADALVQGRNTALAASVRYQRQFGWSKRADDGDQISGIVRGSATLLPGLTLEAGGLATRENYGGGNYYGSSRNGGSSNETVYAVYAGPSLTQRVGDLDVSGSYRFGFNTTDDHFHGDGANLGDTFDKSIVNLGDLEAGFAPGTLLPVGLGAAGSVYQENISYLDQRDRDAQARALVTVPVSRTVQVVGAIGYEDVQVSNRDAKRDADGNPIVGSDGRYETDKDGPRQIAYDTSGLIWDVAVMWRPSPRTSFAAHVGRRYGQTNYGGTLAYAPNDRSQLSIAVFDTMSGYGGQIDTAINSLSTSFEAVRDPVSGQLEGCVSSLSTGNCVTSTLGAVRSGIFFTRGVTVNYSMRIGRLTGGLGGGYYRRRYLGADNTILASADGTVDKTAWLSAFVSGPLGRDAGWSATAYADWTTEDSADSGDEYDYGLAAGYYRLFTPRLRGTVAVSVDGTTYKQPSIDDIWSATALAGLRYTF